MGNRAYPKNSMPFRKIKTFQNGSRMHSRDFIPRKIPSWPRFRWRIKSNAIMKRTLIQIGFLSKKSYKSSILWCIFMDLHILQQWRLKKLNRHSGCSMLSITYYKKLWRIMMYWKSISFSKVWNGLILKQKRRSVLAVPLQSAFSNHFHLRGSH